MNKIAVIRNGKIVYDDVKVVLPNSRSAKENREHMKREHRRELTQPNQVDFYKAYPDKAKEMYNEDTLRLLS